MKRPLSFLLLTALVPASEALEADRDVWINAMTTALPNAFCQPQQFFRQCFDISEALCMETATQTTRQCLQQFSAQFPQVFQQPADGAYWGTKVGECAGEAYQSTLSKAFKNTAKCNDVNQWL
ncbi:MAG: hypothetical protein LRY66_03735 [Saccharospirillaceae bacterium]|nr:hypothetical protein [Saccharospirillaceae bacterium]MCD8530471.1 hypothetical protein [Saccharospirillaceae bacterium]